MRIFRETLIILIIYLLGELLSKSLSLPIPGNILGMLILLVLLLTKVIKVEKVENVSNFFLNNLAFFFIPSGVSIIASFDSIKGDLFAIVILCILTTILVFVTTGKTVEAIMNLKSKIEKRGK